MNERPEDRLPDLAAYERTHDPRDSNVSAGSSTSANAVGILAGVVSGLAICALVFFGPMMIKLEHGMWWLWFSWLIAPVAGVIGGFVIGGFVRHVMSSRAEASAGEPARDLRHL